MKVLDDFVDAFDDVDVDVDDDVVDDVEDDALDGGVKDPDDVVAHHTSRPSVMFPEI